MERSIFTLERKRRNALTAARKERLERRKEALQFAIEVKLIALGFGVLTAAKVAALALKLNWQRARDEMRKFGYDYLQMQWV